MTLSLKGIYARVFLLLSKPTGVKEEQSVDGVLNLFHKEWNETKFYKVWALLRVSSLLTSHQQYPDSQWHSKTE